MEINDKKCQQQQHFAVFVDILGTTGRLVEAGKNASKLKGIARDIGAFYSALYENTSEWGRVEDPSWGHFRPFSDNVYISIPVRNPDKKPDYPYYRLVEELTSIGIAQAKLILNPKRKRIFIRGGLTYGVRAYYSKEIEASNAYYEAYQLEKQAKYPIIRISEAAVKKIQSLRGYKDFENDVVIEKPFDILVWEEKLGDGRHLYFLDYLSCYLDSYFNPFPKLSCDTTLESHKKALIEAYQNLDKQVNDEEERTKIGIKYAYLAHKYHNRYVIKKRESEDLCIVSQEIPSLEVLDKKLQEIRKSKKEKKV